MATSLPLRSLILRDRHLVSGARMAPFAGWEMPIYYSGIVEEHTAVRERVGVFDVSHLGRARVRGAEAGAAIRSAGTYNVLTLEPGEAHYSLYCTDDGGIADDVFVYRLPDDEWLVVHNAANAEVDFQRLRDLAGAAAQEETLETVMLAVQGPEALDVLRRVVGAGVSGLPLHRCGAVDWRGERLLAARTGYTGEDGAELIVPAGTAGALWDALLEGGAAPVGLGARDTLRLEAALPLHGHDITPDTHPYESGLGWVVSLDDAASFIGREALVRLKETPRTRRLAHLRALERGVLREDYVVQTEDDTRQVGVLTSGAFSPTLRTGIGMAYLPPDFAVSGTRLSVDVRGRALPVEVVRRPFYRRPA